MYTTILDFWEPRDEFVTDSTGYTYYDRKSIIKSTKEISDTTEIGLFEQFYKLNNSLRYCNGSHYKFQDKQWEEKYNTWLKSDDYKAKSFNLFYGSNGVVD